MIIFYILASLAFTAITVFCLIIVVKNLIDDDITFKIIFSSIGLVSLFFGCVCAYASFILIHEANKEQTKTIVIQKPVEKHYIIVYKMIDNKLIPADTILTNFKN